MILSKVLCFEDEVDYFREEVPEIKINRIFPERVNKLTYIKGIVKKVESKTLLTFSSYYCSVCGATSYVVQELPEITEPLKCKTKTCGKINWNLDNEKSETSKGTLYTIVADGSNYNEKILVYSTDFQDTVPGATFEGVIYPRTYYSKLKKTTIEYSILIGESKKKNALEEDIVPLTELKEDSKKIIKNENILEDLLSIFRDFKGDYLNEIKKAIIYQIISTSFTNEGSSSRCTLNILLVGEPGTGKSSLLKRVSELCGTIMVNGSVSTSAGIIAACVKSEKEEGYTLEAGSCLLSDRNVLCIDELDKSKSRSIIEELHEPMEQGVISFNKAGLHLTLNSRVAFLIAMNPQKNLEGEAEKVFKTKYLTNSFLNRIDLLFYIKEGDVSSAESLEMISDNRRAPSEQEIADWRKKIAVIKSFEDPVIPMVVAKVLFDYYKLLEQNKKAHFQRNEITQEKFLITMRQREALERLSKSIAKSKLREEVTLEDAREAIEISSSSIYSLFNKPSKESQRIPIEKKTIETKQDKVYKILSVLKNPLRIQEIVDQTGYISIQVQGILQNLMKTSQVYSPKIGYYQRILKIE